jgi:hypothetical protein
VNSDHCGLDFTFLFFPVVLRKVEKNVATELMEETQRISSITDAYPIDLNITPKTGCEDLREIGAIGTLLVELVKDTCGLNGRIIVEATPSGVRVRVEPNGHEVSSVASIGGA